MKLDFGVKYLEGLKKMREHKMPKKEEDIKVEIVEPPMNGELLGIRYQVHRTRGKGKIEVHLKVNMLKRKMQL